MNSDSSPFARLCEMHATLRRAQACGDTTWRDRIPEMLPLIDQITDPQEQEQIRALTAEWMQSVFCELTALKGQSVLLQAREQYEEETR